MLIKKENLLKEFKEIRSIVDFLNKQGVSDFLEPTGRGAVYRAAARASIINFASTLKKAQDEYFIGSRKDKSLEGFTAMSSEMTDDYLETNVQILWKVITLEMPNLVGEVVSMIEG